MAKNHRRHKNPVLVEVGTSAERPCMIYVSLAAHFLHIHRRNLLLFLKRRIFHILSRA